MSVNTEDHSETTTVSLAELVSTYQRVRMIDQALARRRMTLSMVAMLAELATIEVNR